MSDDARLGNPQFRVASMQIGHALQGNGQWKDIGMNERRASAEYVTAFATGWPEERPDLLVLSLTTASGVRDFAMSKEQALLVARTIRNTTAALKKAPSRN